MEKYNLQRFVDAQENAYEHALQEMRRGFKWGHWIWYIFPQLKGLGHSYNSDFYGISGLDEASAYLAHPILGRRLREITEVLLTHSDKSAEAIFTEIDAKKVRSSMTLFDAVCTNDIFGQVINKYYDGNKDTLTLNFLYQNHEKLSILNLHFYSSPCCFLAAATELLHNRHFALPSTIIARFTVFGYIARVRNIFMIVGYLQFII